jgi:hypothetical protein
MRAIPELLAACTRNENEAWDEFWPLLHSVTFPLIKERVLRGHWPEISADGVLQEFYLHLTSRSCHPLRAFRGKTLWELKAYLREAASRFTTRMLRHWRSSNERELRAWLRIPPGRRDGPSAEEIQAALHRVEAAMTDSDLAAFKALRPAESWPVEGTSSLPHTGVSPRTVRRKRRKLFDKYRHFAE